MKSFSVSTKLTVALLAVFLAGNVFVAVLCNIGARHLILAETLAEAANNVAYESEKINGWLSAQKMLTKTAGTSLVLRGDMGAVKEYCAFMANDNSQLLEMYLGFGDDTAVFGNADSIPPGWKATARPWYIGAMEQKGEVIVTSPYEDAQTGKMCVTLAQFCGQMDGMDAVMGIDVEIDTLLDLVSEIDLGEGGYAFMADQDGLFITHPDPNYMSTTTGTPSMKDDAHYAAIYENRSGGHMRFTDTDGAARYVIPASIDAAGWNIYAVLPEKDIYSQTTEQMIVTLLISAVIMALTSVVIRLVIKRFIMKPVTALTDASLHIINGDLDINIATGANDEIGTALHAFKNIKETINMVISDLGAMASAHSGGDFDFRLDETKYLGDYKDVADRINAMVNMYVDNLSGIMKLLQNVGKGDFNAHVKAYPGKQAVYNEIIESFRSKLTDINREISFLGGAAADGNLAARVNTAGFEGGWLKIAVGLNNMVNAFSQPVEEAVAVLSEMAKGNLSVLVKGSYKGDFSLIKDSVNNLSGEISSYISEINAVLNEIANNNNLNVEIGREYIGDFASIKESINRIVTKLNEFIGGIERASDQVSDESKQVSHNAGILAEGSAEQTRSVDELVAAVSGIGANTDKNAENAEFANKLSAQSKENAFKASGEMRNMLHSIEEIKEASHNISKIIKVIEDIAFQTNLLSLNAAVEAARAGESGKGFAVVAEEVRTLAGRSQHSAEETSAIIEDTIKKVNEGVARATNAANALNTIIDGVTEVSKIVDEISRACVLQSSSVSEVACGLDGISQIVLNNSDTSQQLASASEELQGQSEILKNMIDVFKI